MSQQRQFKWPPQPQLSPPQLEQPPTWASLYQGSPPFQPASMPPLPHVQQPQWSPSVAQTASVCRRCGKELSFLDRLRLDKKAPRCRTCNNRMQQSLQHFRAKFLEVTYSGTLTPTGWTQLQYLAAQEHLDLSEALAFIGNDAVTFVERIVTHAEANGGPTDEVEQHVSYLLRALFVPSERAQPILRRLEYLRRRKNLKLLERAVTEVEMKGVVTKEAEQHIYRLQAALTILPEEAQPILQRLTHLKYRMNVQHFQRTMADIEAKGEVTEETQHSILQLQSTLAIPNEVAQPAFQRLAYLKKLTNIRKGNLPTIATSVQLESDEVCHLETAATYHKVNAKSTTLVHGRLIATSKKLYFLPATQGRGTTIMWSNMMRVEVRTLPPPHGGVFLELSKGTGNGLYTVADPTLVGTVLDTLVKISKRQLVTTKTDTSRHIPQDVKNAVWQRDGGKCVQCAATSYLEFDHIIPHTKGGANTVANVQLLCRNCNLKKSDRI